MRQSVFTLTGLAGAMALSACGQPTAENATGQAATAEPATPGQVTREEVQPPAPAAPAPLQQAAIQTQPGPKNAIVTLNKVAVTGDVLTVQLSYLAPKSEGSQWIKLDQVSLVDDATA